MKLKRLLASAMAGFIAVGGVVGGSIIGSADETIYEREVFNGALGGYGTAYQLRYDISEYPFCNGKNGEKIRVTFKNGSDVINNGVNIKAICLNKTDQSDVARKTKLIKTTGIPEAEVTETFDLGEFLSDVTHNDKTGVNGESARDDVVALAFATAGSSKLGNLVLNNEIKVEVLTPLEKAPEESSSEAESSSEVESSSADVSSSETDPSDLTVYKEIDLGNFDVGTSWGSSKGLAADNFADAKAGDTVTLDFTENSSEYYWQLKIMSAADGWPPLSGPSPLNAYQCVELAAGDMTFSFKLTEDDVATLKANGMMLSGYGVTYTKLTLAAPGGDSSSSDVSSETSSEVSSETSSEISSSDVSSEAVTSSEADLSSADTNTSSTADTSSKSDVSASTAVSSAASSKSASSAGSKPSDSVPNTGVAGGLSAAVILSIAGIAAIKKKNS